MSEYHSTLAAYLNADANKQSVLAVAIGKSQAAVSRYAGGTRWPDLETARAIDASTGGAVPLSLWQIEAARRIGLADGQIPNVESLISRVALCSACDLRAESPQIRSCTRTDCPMRALAEQQEAA
ncbi:hypothetical protein QH494_16075 [Sphingomonas sp. AR_OL41]|uniref:hypothetical protein n=1 Tax=Sphingomonas sp. AR_OL41 TaxID=3042729 RepID=UPI0024812BF8|nr:hypothetical protein [Sphingomonas sp. AR_OL41]MDH7973710.1 hypothetical protein [Sphingomonas sp. AR_OL41]